MSHPTGTDGRHLDDLWRAGPEPGTADTQPLPIARPGRSRPGRDRPGRDLPGRGRTRRDGRRRPGSRLLEILLATLVSVAVAAVVGWTALRRPALDELRRVLLGSGPEPYTGFWSLAWSGHALRPGSGVGVAQLFDGNAFYPADYSLAFGDSLLGFGPLTWFGAGPVLVQNLILVFLPALASVGTYALARQLGANPVGAAVAGAGFAYAPWHLGQVSQPAVLATGPLVLALALLARGHGLTMTGRRAPGRPLWALLGWLVAAWQLTIGTLGLPFAGLLALIAVAVVVLTPARLLLDRRRRRIAERPDPFADPYPDAPGVAEPDLSSGPRDAVEPARPRRRTARLIVVDVIGAGAFAVTGALMAYPYLRVRAIDPDAVAAARSVIALRSPAPVDLIAPPEVDGTWSWLLSGIHGIAVGSGGPALLPGVILLALALLGLAVSSWRRRWRLTLLLAAALVAALTVGTRFPDAWFPGPDAPYTLLLHHTPSWVVGPAPAALIVLVTLALALLAAGAVSRLGGRGRPGHRGRARRVAVLALAVLPVLIVLEGWGRAPTVPVTAAPAALTRATGPLVVLPSTPAVDSSVLAWTAARGFPPVANGQNALVPSTHTRMQAELAGFPDARSVAYLRQNGFRSVVVLRAAPDTAPGTPSSLWPAADLPLDPLLSLTRVDLGDSLLYTL